MRKYLISAVLATGLMVGVGGGSALAAGEGTEAETQTTTQQTEMTSETGQMMSKGVTGEVTGVEGDKVKIKAEDGQTYSFEITGAQDLEQLSAETLQTGDKVYVEFGPEREIGEGQYEQGREVNIHKISESGTGTWMEQTGAMEESEVGGEVRTPAEGR